MLCYVMWFVGYARVQAVHKYRQTDISLQTDTPIAMLCSHTSRRERSKKRGTAPAAIGHETGKKRYKLT